MIKYTDLLKLCIVASLILNPIAHAAPKANGNSGNSSSNGNANSGGGNGGQSGAVNNGGNTTGGSTTGLNGGNNGNGVGNTGPGNQGNDKPVGNAGGTSGSSTGGSSTGSSTGGSNGNANSGSASGGSSTGGSSTGSSDNGSTGGFSGGNNGNGVGNTGPGNQGNDTSNGNAGGTTGSSTGGSPTGSSNGGNNGNANGGSTNGNSDNGNTGGFSGGNNGNGNGNTGPGNQGNDTSNGNAGGTTGSSTGGSSTGNSNGGNNGNANGGSSNGNSDNGNTGGFSGGNNGNGNGNTGPGNQGNDGSNGNACGNNCTTGSTNGGTTGSTNGGTTGSTTGSTDGGTTGSTDGGTTGSTTGSTDGGTTGSTTGGETSGGTTTGGTETTGSTDGGSTSGGETSGGTETTGGTETSGGESTGGTETTGGETGESTGGETGETSGGETTGGTTETKLKEKFKVRLLPLGFGNYDILNTAVNLTPADERDILNNEARLDQYEDGFIVTQMKMWDAGLGAMPQAYIENASGLAALPTAAIGLALTKGRYVQYERLVSDEEALNNLKSIPLPLSKKSLDQYQVGESAYFESNGGVLFLAGAGALGAYAGGSVLAEGSFRTLVRKTSANKAIVQIVKANVRTASLCTGAAVLKLDGTRVKQLSHGFNYEFDFSRGGILTVKAFEQLVAGNVSAAQKQALTPDLSGVSRVSDSKSLEVTKKRGVSLGIPMVAMYNWAAGKTYGETATKTYTDRTTTDLNYGVYFKEEKGRFFHKHKKITRSFYATKAVTKDEKAKVLATNEEANYFWSYENDSASTGSLNSAMALFHKDLGLKSAFNPSVARGEKLRFVRLQANVKIPESYIKKLISESVAGRSRGEMQRDAQNLITRYFANGDEADLCRNDDDGSAIADCQQGLVRESMTAVGRIQATLANLKDKKDASSYTYAIALMGKELVKNQFVMNAFFAQDKSCSVNFDVKLEGRRLSRMMTTIPANKNCRR